jgi:hypothetical protein
MIAAPIDNNNATTCSAKHHPGDTRVLRGKISSDQVEVFNARAHIHHHTEAAMADDIGPNTAAIRPNLYIAGIKR